MKDMVACSLAGRIAGRALYQGAASSARPFRNRGKESIDLGAPSLGTLNDLLINPRLTDYYGIAAPQATLYFAIPLFNLDVPLYVNPLLMWSRPSAVDRG